jgi:two-component system phosphate regulon response regulator PhoB
MNNQQILIAEDSPDIREYLRSLLEQEGFEVIEAEDCLTAYDHLVSYHPDLILADLMMPEMTGLEFIRWVRRTSDIADIPIVAMSAYDKNYLAAALAAGADAVLHKPEDLANLVETINKVTRGKVRQKEANSLSH